MSSKQKLIVQVGVVFVVILALIFLIINALNGPNKDSQDDTQLSESSTSLLEESNESENSESLFTISESRVSSQESSGESSTSIPDDQESLVQQLARDEERKRQESIIQESLYQESIQESQYQSSIVEQRVQESIAQIESQRNEKIQQEQERQQLIESIRQRELAKVEAERKEQESIKQESIKQESIKQESILEESRVQESIKQESIKQESILEESRVQESLLQESIKQESILEESRVQESLLQESLIESSIQASISESIRLEQESLDETVSEEPESDEPQSESETSEETPSEQEPLAPELHNFVGAFKWLKDYQDGYILFSLVELGDELSEEPSQDRTLIDTQIGVFESTLHIKALQQDVYLNEGGVYYNLDHELGYIQDEGLTNQYRGHYAHIANTDEQPLIINQYRELITDTFSEFESFMRNIDPTRVYTTDANVQEIELTQEEVGIFNQLFSELYHYNYPSHTIPSIDDAKYYLTVTDTGLLGIRVESSESLGLYKIAIGSDRRNLDESSFNPDNLTLTDLGEFQTQRDGLLTQREQELEDAQTEQ